MNHSIKHLIIVAISALMLVACQQEEKQEEKQSETVVVEKNEAAEAKQAETASTEKTKTAAEQSHNHDHAVNTNGEKYQVIEPQMECEQPVVIEFYAYHCPHCNNLEPAAEAWRKKNAGKVKFLSIPTHLGNDKMGSMLLVHHAAKKLGILEKTQHALFNRFHVERKLFGSADDAAQFLAEQGADLEQAKLALADQKSISASIEADFELLNKYKVTSVPKVLVNHQYITDITMAGSHKGVFEVVDEVLKLENSCAN